MDNRVLFQVSSVWEDIRVSTISLGEGDEVSLGKCMEVPESCSAGVDEIREMASTIKKEVLAELKGRTK